MKYQDYVIKEGVLIGKFEEMYENCENPWNQSEILTSYSRNSTILNIKRFKIKSVVEFGCGHGHYTNMLKNETGIDVLGIDISPTAITNAKKTYNLPFKTDSILNIRNYNQYDAVLFAELTWYILNDIDDIIHNIKKHFKGKYLLHNLVFYKGQQEYGNDFFTTPNEFIDYIPFELLNCTVSNTICVDTIETSMVFKI